MKISEHITNTIENWSTAWKDRLRGWMASWLGFGIELFFDILGKAAAPKLKPFIDTLEATGKVPPELQPLLDELKLPTGQAGAMFANSAGSALIGGALGKIIDALFLPIAYAMNSLTRNVILSPGQLLSLWHRGEMTEEKVNEYLSWLGYEDEDIEHWKLMSWFLPGPMDLVNWQAKEVFEPDMIARYGLGDGFEKLRHEDFRKVGVTEEHELNYWMAHWQHASWMQVVEMLHRGFLTEEQVWDWFTLVEIPPFWRDKLIGISWNVPTRVDVRRWWDMRTITEERLREVYGQQGYHGKDLDDYVLWTKVYVAYPDLVARWKNGWITEDDVRAELTGLGMPADRVEEMLQTRIKPEGIDRVSGERDVTKTDIYKGVKQGVITRGEGIELLIELGYDEDEADYLLTINIPQDEEAVVVKDRELTKSDILSGLKAAIITEAEALTRLESLRYRREDAETILSIFKAAAEPPLEAWQREASKADIVAAVKQGLITPEKAYLMLLDIGFSAEASNFILMVRAEVTPFSPINYGEFRNLTQKYRRAIGREEKPMSDEIIAAGAEVVKLTKDIEALQKAIKIEERGLIADEAIPEEASARRDELRLALHRAESELAAAQTNYNSLVAEWRHKE